MSEHGGQWKWAMEWTPSLCMVGIGFLPHISLVIQLPLFAIVLRSEEVLGEAVKP